MAVKFSQFSSISPSASTFLVGYDGSLNVKVPYSSLVGGSGTTNYLPKWTGSTSLGDSLVFDNGTSVGINTSSPSALSTLDIVGTTGRLYLGNAPTAGGAGIRAVTANAASLTSFEVRSSATYYTGLNTFIIGGTTSAGYLLDVQGTFRSTLDANINGLTVGKGGGSVAENTAIGNNALNANTTSIETTAIGYYSFRANTIGNKNTGVGTYSGFDNVSGSENTFVGAYAGRTSTASHNTMVGSQSGRTTTGGFNTFVGSSSGYSVSTGTYNTILGYSNPGITTGSFNTIIGSQVTGLSSSLSNTIILADGQGNQRIVVNSSGVTNLPKTTGEVLSIGDATLTATTTPAVLNLGGTYGSNAQGNIGNIKIKLLDQNVSSYGLGVSAGMFEFHAPVSFGFYNSASTSRVERMRIAGNGNVLIGTTTDGGQKFQVSGTASITGGTTIGGTLDIQGTIRVPTAYQANPLQLYKAFNGTNALIEFYGGTGSKLVYSTNTRILYPETNAGVSLGTSSLKYNNIYGTNGYFDTVLAIGTTSPNASALVDITSSTKGFLLPRMTGAQAEAIATPAEGLMVYSTDGSGVTITSAGWWGYSGGWVKLN